LKEELELISWRGQKRERKREKEKRKEKHKQKQKGGIIASRPM
jgi:hypothetical protein